MVDRVDVSETPVLVVVRGDAGGRPGPFLGALPVAPGRAEALTVTLDVPLETSGVVWVDVHRDTEPVGELDYPRGDPPLRQGAAYSPTRIAYEVRA